MTEDGLELSPATVRRLACDADLIPIALGTSGEVLDVGRTHRLVTPAIWRALVCRDAHCAFPGCTRPPIMCHAHHITHWADGGDTSLQNMVLLCGHHHRTIHHTPWQVRLNPDDGKPEFLPPPKTGHPPPDWIRTRPRRRVGTARNEPTHQQARPAKGDESCAGVRGSARRARERKSEPRRRKQGRRTAGQCRRKAKQATAPCGRSGHADPTRTTSRREPAPAGLPFQPQRLHRTRRHRSSKLRTVLLTGCRVEHVHDVVVVELEELVRHRLAHAEALAAVAVHADPHQATSRSSWTGTKSTFSRTPQSGQHQVSGISAHAVPAAKPSCSSPAFTSYT